MEPSYIYLLIGIIVIIVILSGTKKASNKAPEQASKTTPDETDEKMTDTLPYEKMKSILTKYEMNFYNTLFPIIDKTEYILLIKPRLADFATIKKGTANYYSWFNKISAKHVDFLLCANETLEPILGIELDDKSHEKESRQKRDAFVDELYKTIGLPILHITKETDIQNLEQLITDALRNSN